MKARAISLSRDLHRLWRRAMRQAGSRAVATRFTFRETCRKDKVTLAIIMPALYL